MVSMMCKQRNGSITSLRRERPQRLTHRASRIPRSRSRLTTYAQSLSCRPCDAVAEHRREKRCLGRTDSGPRAKVECSRGTLSLWVGVKMVRIAFCTFRIATSSPAARTSDLLSMTCNDQSNGRASSCLAKTDAIREANGFCFSVDEKQWPEAVIRFQLCR
jgi:hypothetical protein